MIPDFQSIMLPLLKITGDKKEQGKTRGRFVCHILINGEDRINVRQGDVSFVLFR